MNFFEIYAIYLILAIALLIVLITYIVRSIIMRNISNPTDIALEQKKKNWGTYIVEIDEEEDKNSLEIKDFEYSEPRIEIRHYSKRIYEKLGKEKPSKHALGGKQAVIYGKKYLFLIGLLIVVILSFPVYSLFIEKKSYFELTTVNIIFFLIIAIGGFIWGIKLIYYSTRKIVLHMEGFEQISILGKKSYKYKDADFNLINKLVNVNDQDHYILLFKKNWYRRLWILQISFIDGRKPVTLKSSNYWNLQSKASDLINSLTWIY